MNENTVEYRHLNLTTFNCKNIQACSNIFEEFAKTEDIILIQDDVNEQFRASGKSVDCNNPITPAQIPRGYCGVAIFWRNSIDYLVTDLTYGNERIKCIELSLNVRC